MEYVFPTSGYATIKDQFLMEDSLLVTPVVEKNAEKIIVTVPKGSWKIEEGITIKGPR